MQYPVLGDFRIRKFPDKVLPDSTLSWVCVSWVCVSWVRVSWVSVSWVLSVLGTLCPGYSLSWVFSVLGICILDRIRPSMHGMSLFTSVLIYFR
jgi:hypothetical protein